MFGIVSKNNITVITVENPSEIEQTLIDCARAIKNGKKVSFVVEDIVLEPQAKTEVKKAEPKNEASTTPKIPKIPVVKTGVVSRFKNTTSKVYEYDEKIQDEAFKKNLFDIADTDDEGLPFS